VKLRGNTNRIPLLSPFPFLSIFTHGANCVMTSFSSLFHSLEAVSLGRSSSGSTCFLKCFKTLLVIDFEPSITGRLQANYKNSTADFCTLDVGSNVSLLSSSGSMGNICALSIFFFKSVT
jgi:hypothetical protein